MEGGILPLFLFLPIAKAVSVKSLVTIVSMTPLLSWVGMALLPKPFPPPPPPTTTNEISIVVHPEKPKAVFAVVLVFV